MISRLVLIPVKTQKKVPAPIQRDDTCLAGSSSVDDGLNEDAQVGMVLFGAVALYADA